MDPGKEVWNTVENSGVWENKTCLTFCFVFDLRVYHLEERSKLKIQAH